METLIVYSSGNSNRLKYALDWLLKERLHLDYSITTNKQDTDGLDFFISYGQAMPGALSIPDSGLLWQKDVSSLAPPRGLWHDVPTLFAMPSGSHTVPFDLLAAVFFLLSRYEEYNTYTPDKHGRFPASKSILYKNGWLSRPLADEWVSLFREQLRTLSGMHTADEHYLFRPTYDIDMAYSHIHKGAGRIVGAYIRALLKGDVKQISERTQVLKYKQKDPYDSFRWLRQLHKEYDCRPVYFVLAATRTTAFDKNIHPQHPAMVRVIKNIARDGAIGIHPSYFAEQENKAGKERKLLEHVAGRAIHISRQHYIRMKLPDTYRHLLKNDIREDYSMGYGSHLGFRAGTGASFLWYDLGQEAVTTLRIYPFCFMDTTAHFDAKLSVAQAFEQLQAMRRILEQCRSTLTTVFHNFSLGTAAEWKGWKQAYEQFVMEQSAGAWHLDKTSEV